MPYERAYGVQCEHHEQVLAARGLGSSSLGRILTVEHPPIITVTRRPEAQSHITASESLLAQHGVTLHETDRGGDVTYHGPGQLVCYPIIDLNAAKLRIHDYIRLLENAVIETLGEYGLIGTIDPGATGVWIDPAHNSDLAIEMDQPAKVCAIGVRVRKWITLHGLAVNIDPDMDHFDLIVPCGLAGRPVVSLRQVLGDRCPTMDAFSRVLTDRISALLLKNIETKALSNGYTTS